MTARSVPRMRLLLICGGVVCILGVAVWLVARPFFPKNPTAQTAANDATKASASPSPNSPTSVSDSKTNESTDSFLDSFGKDAATEATDKQSVLSNAELEARFTALEKFNDQRKALVDRVRIWGDNVDKREYQTAIAERDRLIEKMNGALASLEKDLATARKARPEDLTVAWLTGELMIYIGAEPELILPYLQKASSLKRPRVWASMARTQTELNRLAEAYQTATKALQGDATDPYIWRAFTQTATNLEHFDEVLGQLDRVFPKQMPEWAAKLRRKAADQGTRWHAEQQLRQAEARADDLPRVRITVEHRRFAQDAAARERGAIESTGTGAFVVELFADQAPATVANFLKLVAKKTYDGTRFHLAESASVVAGGDPHSKGGDPLDDGTGGPGYAIADEFASPKARSHFRGVLSMVNTGPATAGSQFFITLVPKLEMDGYFTVFGRVVQGMDVVENITRGRTNMKVGHFGQIIPGDLLVRAEVIRQRALPKKP